MKRDWDEILKILNAIVIGTMQSTKGLYNKLSNDDWNNIDRENVNTYIDMLVDEKYLKAYYLDSNDDSRIAYCTLTMKGHDILNQLKAAQLHYGEIPNSFDTRTLQLYYQRVFEEELGRDIKGRIDSLKESNYSIKSVFDV